jgi:hypothetical protein
MRHQKGCVATHGRAVVWTVITKNECRPTRCWPTNGYGCTSLDYEVLQSIGG